jgi:hypothetical protein
VELAVLHNFTWHCRWTWRDRLQGGPSLLARLLAFNLTTGLTSVAGNVLAMAVLAGVWGVPPLAALPLAVALTSAANFAVSDRCVFRPACVLAVAALALTPSAARAEGPGAETLAGWSRYVTQTEARLAAGPPSWLSADERRRVLQGSPIVLEGPPPEAGAVPEIPGGTLQHWRGAIFVPGTTTGELVEALKSRPPDQEGITRARVLARTGETVSVYMRLVYRKIVTVTYDTEHHVHFRRAGPGAVTSRSVMVRADEIAAAETPRERTRPAGEGRGFLWKLNSYGRYTDVPGGVLVEIESLTLSRVIPRLIRPIAGPIVQGVARDSMQRALEGVRRQAS